MYKNEGGATSREEDANEFEFLVLESSQVKTISLETGWSFAELLGGW